MLQILRSGLPHTKCFILISPDREIVHLLVTAAVIEAD